MAAMVDWVLGLLDATGLELMFGISALIGGVLFLLWLILIVVLGGIGDIAEGVLGINIDAMGADAAPDERGQQTRDADQPQHDASALLVGLDILDVGLVVGQYECQKRERQQRNDGRHVRAFFALA